MVDVFEEVDEQLRQDRYQDALKQWGPWVGGVSLAIIILVAGYQWWVSSQNAAIDAASESYFSAVEQLTLGNSELADTGLETLSNEGTSGYRTLAILQRAAIALENDDLAGAADLFDQAAASTSEPIIRDLAQLKAIWARWETLSFADIEIRLTPLTGAASPYRFLARESIAAAALRNDDLARAESEYQFLAFSFETTEDMRRRAQEALAVIAARNAVAGPAEPVSGTDSSEALGSPLPEAETPAITAQEEIVAEDAAPVETEDAQAVTEGSDND